MNKTNYINYILVAVLIFLIGLALGRYAIPVAPIETIRTKIDTVVVERPVIRVEKAQAKMIIKKSIVTVIDTVRVNDTLMTYDTVYMVAPFTACLDTIMPTRDTINARYYFPANLFDILIKPKPDSIQVQTITITKQDNEAFWIKPVIAVGGILLGYFLGGK